MDIDCIFFQMKFEGGLSISFLRNKATLYKEFMGSKPMSFQKFKFSSSRHLPLVLLTHKETICTHVSVVSADFLCPPYTLLYDSYLHPGLQKTSNQIAAICQIKFVLPNHNLQRVNINSATK